MSGIDLKVAVLKEHFKQTQAQYYSPEVVHNVQRRYVQEMLYKPLPDRAVSILQRYQKVIDLAWYYKNKKSFENKR